MAKTIDKNLTPEQKTGINQTAQETSPQAGVVDVGILESKVEPLPEVAPTPDIAGRTSRVAETIGEQAVLNRQKADETAKETARIQAEQQKEEAKVRQLGGEVLGRGDAETQAFADAKISESQKAIDDLDKAILASSKALKQQAIDDRLAVESEAGRGLGIPANIVRGRQALLQNQLKAKRDSQALELENDIATSALLQGKVDTAKQAIQRKVELQFADKKLELEQEIQWLSRTDSKLAESKATELKAVEKAEAELNDVFNIAAQARQAGAGQSEISAIMKSKDKAEALRNAGSLGRMARLESAIKSAQLDKLRSESNGLTTELNTEAKQKIIRTSKDSRNLIDGILGSRGGSAIVGSKVIDRGIFSGSQFEFAGKDNFKASVSQLLASNFIKGIVDAKSQGANFGSLTEQEGAKLAT